MRLSALLASLPPELAPREAPAQPRDPVIRGITYNSRQVAPGDLFVALAGSVTDGHDYLTEAVELGAAALLVQDTAKAERAVSPGDRRIPVVTVPDSRRAMAPIAARFFGHPASALTLIGITGTNGKTSTSYLVESILKCAGASTGLIGTVEIRYGAERLRAVNTTPESLDLQRVLRAMHTHGVDTVVMEVSSHGLELGRVTDCGFRVGAITNVTQDHLDFHGSMESYLESKLRLFRGHIAPGGAAVINLDDSSAERSLQTAKEAGVRVLGVTRDTSRSAEVVLRSADVTLEGTRAEVLLPRGPLQLDLPLLGDFNLENLLVACGIAAALDLDGEVIAEGVRTCPQVPGRMELVRSRNPGAPTVIVDYAHTPDAVSKLLEAVRPLARGRLITVFGCGGDRDRSKRPLMAEAVARNSDRVVATSDNPRTEDPEQILRDVEKGLSSLQRVEIEEFDSRDHSYVRVTDRRTAIDRAIAIANSEDTVVLAGKGHEDYQIIGRNKLPFDDRVEAGRALASWSAAR